MSHLSSRALSNNLKIKKTIILAPVLYRREKLSLVPREEHFSSVRIFEIEVSVPRN
jgi:hypothetical protein